MTSLYYCRMRILYSFLVVIILAAMCSEDLATSCAGAAMALGWYYSEKKNNKKSYKK